MPKLIDTHSHINFNAYKDDADEVVKRAFDNDIHMLAIGSQIDTSKRAVMYARKYQEGMWAVVGLHPIHLEEADVDEEEVRFKTRKEEFAYDAYKELAQDPKVVAIGECGLDYYRIDDMPADNDYLKQRQKHVFKEQMRLAEELNLPLTIHCRNAYEDLLATVKAFITEGHATPRAVMHCYLGDKHLAQEFLQLGFYLSFSGIITFPNAGDIVEVVKAAPLDRIVVETDCPYLTPVPHRGKRNEPRYIKYTAERVAEVKDISFDEVAKTTTKNAQTLFKLV